MPRTKKRTISELLKSRQSSKSSFDLLGEGDIIMAEIDKAERSEVATSSLFADTPTSVDHLSYIENDTNIDPAIASIAKRLYSGDFSDDASAIGQNSIAGNAIVDSTMEAGSIANNSIAVSAIAGNLMERDAIAVDAVALGSMAEGAIAGEAIEKYAMAGDSIENGAMARSSIAGSAIVENATVEPFVADGAIAGSAIVSHSIESKSIASESIEKDSIEDSAIAGKDKIDSKKSSIKKSDFKNPKLPSSKILQGIGTRQAYQESHQEIERLKADTGTTTVVDNYVFDILFKEINNPSESMVYLYLWRRTYGSGKKNVELSYQVLSDAIGVSKRGGQEMLKRLNEKKLIKIELGSKTGIPSYEVICPWQKK